MTTGRPAAGELFIERLFAHPIERVWDAWVTPEAVAIWLGPKGSTSHVIEGDIRPGGVLRMRMETEAWSMLTLFRYREVTRPHRLIYEHCFCDADGNLIRPVFFEVWPLKLLTTVTFEEMAGEDGGRRTRVTLRWRPLDATPEEERAFAENLSSMQGGLAGSFDQLEAYLAA